MKRLLSSIVCFLILFSFCFACLPQTVFATDTIVDDGTTLPGTQTQSETETEEEVREPNIWNGDKISIPIAAGKNGYTYRSVYAPPYHAYEMSNHMVSVDGTHHEIPQTLMLVDASSSYTWTPNGLFNPANSNYRVLYCCDAETGYSNGIYYKRLNLEDSVYYTQESAKHIRSIVTYSYPYVDLNVMKARLKADGFQDADKLTRAEIITAVQSAIWAFANVNAGRYNYSRTFDVSTNSQWGGVVHDYTNEMDVWWTVGYKKFTTSDEVGARINSLINFLCRLQGQTAGRDQIIITGLEIEDCVPINKKDGVYTVALKLNLNTSGNSGDSVDIKIAVNEQVISTQPVVPGTDSYNIVVQAKAGETISAVVSGKQYVANGVYFYEAEGGRGISQSLVDFAGGETDVYCEAKVSLPDIPESPKANVILYKTNDNGEALTGAAFALYVVGKTGNVYVDTYSVNENGILSLEGLVPGTYTLSETTTPEGFLNLNGDIQFKVTDAGEVETVSLPREVTVTGSEGTYTISVVNVPEFVNISGKKTWDDEDNFDGLRPASITIYLLANDEIAQTKTVTEADGWAWTFRNLPTIVNDVRIVYTIREEAVDHYETVVDGYNVINKHVPEDVEVSGQKTWNDSNNHDNIRPASITIHLLANGEIVQTKTVTAADEWKWSFTELPMYKDGVLLAYTVSEEPVAGYTSAVDGYNITNTHEPEKVTIAGTKIWNDDNNRDGKRPASITINLLADGEIVQTKTVTPAADGSWSWSFTDLLKYNAGGTEIIYTITEEVVEGYTTEINGFDVTNTHEPETTEVAGSKTWEDDDNHDGKRPESITINLLADGNVVKTVVVTAENGWTWNFTDLPVYRDGGIKIVYTITEEAVAGYTAEIDGYNVKNTHEPEKISVAGSKTWADDDNRDGKRPASITINLLADGEIVQTKTVTPDDEGNWSWNFTDLLKYHEDGVEIVYTITEEAVEGYTTEVKGYDVTNNYEPEKTKVDGIKTWADDDNRDGKRPVSITINLLADGKVIKTVTVTEADGWAWSFTDLLKYRDNGVEIVYTITEEVVEGYTTEINGFDVTNTHEPETTEVAGSKTWADDDNRDGKRPESITINLLADGRVIKTVTVTEADGWAWSFTDLLKYRDNGVEIVYTITEEAVEGYTTEVKGYDVTNNYEPETTEVAGSKTWEDDDNRDGIRPESIIINLLADGEIVDTKIVAATADGAWAWNFTDLLKYRDNGVEIVYTITEEAVEGYTTEINGFDVTNTHEPETTEVAGSKTWDDDDNRDGVRPESITINLLADGEVIKTVTVTEVEEWAWSFTELPVYRDGGVEIVYTITEDAVSDYSTTINGYDVTNSYTPGKTSINGSKTWNDDKNRDGIRPESITINLLADGVVIKTVTVTEADGWAWRFTELPVYRDGGVEIVYTITEEAVEGYTTEIDDYNVKNSYEPAKTKVEGIKTWEDDDNRDGKRPASITINLLADGKVIKTVTVTEADGWAWRFTELPVYRDGGAEIVYTITEEAVEGYTTVINGYNVTNRYEPELMSVKVVKAWVYADDQDGIRPEDVTVNLYANGEFTGKAVILSAANNWTAGFDNLYVRENGVEIRYEVKEIVPEGYTATITGNAATGFVITNSLSSETVDISGYKMWVDNNNQSGKRPESIVINLVANGETVASKVVTAEDGWAWTFKNLPAYENGSKIVYRITEDTVPGYETRYQGYNVINHLIEETVTYMNIPVGKIWDDFNNAMGARPNRIVVELLANGVNTGATLTLSADNNWTASFTNLPVVDGNGNTIQYTVAERAVDYYIPTITGTAVSGFTIINTYQEEFEEEPVPMSPPTGDITFNLILALSFAAASFVLAVATKRRNRKNNRS